MKISTVVLTLLFNSFAFCQANTDTKAAQPEQIVKVVRVRGNADKLGSLACASFAISCRPSRELRALVLRGSLGDVARVEQTIHKLDSLDSEAAGSALKNVETTVYVIAGSAEPIPETQDVSGEALTPVVKQLRAIFPYDHYQLLSTMLLRSSEGSRAETSGLMKGVTELPDSAQPPNYKVGYANAIISNSPSQSIQLKAFEFSAGIPFVTGSLKSKSADSSRSADVPYATTQFRVITIGTQADVDLREGQKVVVGKVNVGDSNTCFFIVLSARLVP